MVKLKHILLGIAIALISVFFFAYAVQAVYPGPEYEDYCPVVENQMVKAPVLNAEDCDARGGRWNSYEDRPTPDGQTGWCELDYICRKDFDADSDVYERNVFFANLIIGVVTLVGAFFLALEPVSAGLMGGAVMLIVYGTMRNWGNLSDIWRTLVLGLSLALLIGLAYKKLND